MKKYYLLLITLLISFSAQAEFATLKAKANGNDVDAQSALGLAYFYDEQPKQAFRYLKKATDSGKAEPEIIAILGMLYYQEYQDSRNAVYYLEKSIALGNADPYQYIMLGIIYYEEKQYHLAFNYLNRMYETDKIEPEIYFFLSIMYGTGNGVEQNNYKARKLMNLACLNEVEGTCDINEKIRKNPDNIKAILSDYLN